MSKSSWLPVTSSATTSIAPPFLNVAEPVCVLNCIPVPTPAAGVPLVLCSKVTGYSTELCVVLSLAVLSVNVFGIRTVSPFIVSVSLLSSFITRLPPILPPTYRFSAMPTPPDTTSAPVELLVLAVVDLTATSMLDVISRSVVSSVIRRVPPVWKNSVSSSSPGAVSAMINVSPSTSLTPPSVFQAMPS